MSTAKDCQESEYPQPRIVRNLNGTRGRTGGLLLSTSALGMSAACRDDMQGGSQRHSCCWPRVAEARG